MKQIYLFLCGLFSVAAAPAQDTLVMNDGTEKYVKVLEIGGQTLSYKNAANPAGPSYTIDIGKVFMAIYKGGKREVFKSGTLATNVSIAKPADTAAAHALHNDAFEVRLITIKNNPDKRGTALSVTATIDVYAGAKLFGMTLMAYQQTDKTFNYEEPNGYYYGRNFVSISVQSEKLNDMLFDKYENYGGKGNGWAIPPGFFAANSSSPCTIALMESKGISGFTNIKMPLQDCSSVENKLLSVALIWLNTNLVKNREGDK